MIKSQELSDPNSCLNKARADERVFVLLERDPAMATAINTWIKERIALKKNEPNDPQIKEAEALVNALTGGKRCEFCGTDCSFFAHADNCCLSCGDSIMKDPVGLLASYLRNIQLCKLLFNENKELKTRIDGVSETERALEVAKSNIEELQEALASTRKSHAEICNAIKNLLGYKNWPPFRGPFVPGMLKLLTDEIERLRNKPETT